MKTISCDVVLIPDNDLSAKAIKASQSLSVLDSYFTLKKGAIYLHLSLYMFELSVNRVPEVTTILEDISTKYSQCEAEAIKYTLGSGGGVGYIDAEYEVSDKLNRLQELVINGINPIRSDMKVGDKERMFTATGLKLENFKKYGYPAIGNLFRPHITLTKLITHTPVATQLLPGIRDLNGKFDRIGLFEMGEHGTCIKKIAQYELKSP